MRTPESEQRRLRRVEFILAAILVLMKMSVLHGTWGKIQGFDWGSWIEMFHVTHWFRPLAPATLWGATYHPPMSYLIGRLIYPLYPHEVEISQVDSTLAIVVAFFALRYVLRHIGCLWTLPGLWVLYGGISIPVIVSLGVETTYDSWVLGWFMLALAFSVSLFWDAAASKAWWTRTRFTRRLTALGLVLAAGQLNKYNGLLAFGLPFAILLIRRGTRIRVHEVAPPLVAVLIGVVVVLPFYYERNYSHVGQWMPAAMDWQRKDDLVQLRLRRDATPVAFVAHMLRYPLTAPENPQTPVMDSFLHLTWLQTWTKDIWLGAQPEPSLTFSRIYRRLFAYTTLLGTAAFLFRARRMPRNWRDAGWLLLGITIFYSVLALTFGWKYPLWDWRVFKAKYMTPVVFWVPYATAALFGGGWWSNIRGWFKERLHDLALLALLAFVLINHILPVY